jgi:hypothetical protein
MIALVSITITNPNASYPKLNVSPKAILFELARIVCVSGSNPLRCTHANAKEAIAPTPPISLLQEDGRMSDINPKTNGIIKSSKTVILLCSN